MAAALVMSRRGSITPPAEMSEKEKRKNIQTCLGRVVELIGPHGNDGAIQKAYEYVIRRTKKLDKALGINTLGKGGLDANSMKEVLAPGFIESVKESIEETIDPTTKCILETKRLLKESGEKVPYILDQAAQQKQPVVKATKKLIKAFESFRTLVGEYASQIGILETKDILRDDETGKVVAYKVAPGSRLHALLGKDFVIVKEYI